MDRAGRLHALTEELRRAGDRGRTAVQLAELFEVTPRTIKRDISALIAAGIPVWAQSGPGGGYGLAGRPTLPPVNFTAPQAVAVAAALAMGVDSPFAVDGRAALAKLLDVLDPESRLQAEQLGARIWVRGGADVHLETAAKVRRVVGEALLRSRIVSLRYGDKDGAESIRLVEPQLLAQTRGQWYLVAWCRTREDVRWFRFDRVKDIALTGQRFAPRDPRIFGEPPPDARAVLRS